MRETALEGLGGGGGGGGRKQKEFSFVHAAASPEVADEDPEAMH